VSAAGQVLALNAGSSSLKLGLFDATGEAQLAERQASWDPEGAKHAAVLPELLNGIDPTRIAAVGHRVVHGGLRFTEPVLIDTRVREEIETLASLAPLHNRPALAAIAKAARLVPGVP
jgi:acetate kinase